MNANVVCMQKLRKKIIQINMFVTKYFLTFGYRYIKNNAGLVYAPSYECWLIYSWFYKNIFIHCTLLSYIWYIKFMIIFMILLLFLTVGWFTAPYAFRVYFIYVENHLNYIQSKIFDPVHPGYLHANEKRVVSSPKRYERGFAN